MCRYTPAYLRRARKLLEHYKTQSMTTHNSTYRVQDEPFGYFSGRPLTPLAFPKTKDLFLMQQMSDISAPPSRHLSEVRE
ncbi:hypothetical protein ARMSODRAFT_342593 [Armillaria solidipes]|uniref:Uncharacterized protein n=1 Tax=Armillaria solidipes TaxID=1076256 RepID=A0A2H3BCV5_9AGAR|nr:hypothetical protein ARMSODRAFT_342593 [Armillaria solidipes]